MTDRELESRQMIQDVLQKAYTLYCHRESDYSDSWRDYDSMNLFTRLAGEYDEHLMKPFDINELLDMINVAAMLICKIESSGIVK